MNYFNYRESYCWDCKQPISNADSPTCPVCGWIICPNCGACRQFGCVSVAFIERRYRKVLRDMWISLPTPKPTSVENWASDTANRIKEHEKRQMEQQRALVRDSYRKRIDSGERVYHPMYGYGSPVRIILEGKKEKIIVKFPSNGEKRFNFPDSFFAGGLRFESEVE